MTIAKARCSLNREHAGDQQAAGGLRGTLPGDWMSTATNSLGKGC